MFDGNEKQNATIKELAESIVLTESQIEDLEKAVVTKKEALIALMQQTGQTAVKLDSGLSPRIENQTRISKRKEIENEQLFTWLNDNGLGELIKPSVHAGTLQTALEEYTAQGNSLPEEIFHEYEQTVIRFNGKTKFLQARQNNSHE
jgi:hypothetical protein